jgi:hypothetical protein
MLARTKSSRFIYNKFTSNLKILAINDAKDYAVGEIGRKNTYIFSKCSNNHKCQCGAMLEPQFGDPEVNDLSPACVN